MPNRLAAERSPYLLQHADNPVDWFPWGPEAFEKARAEDKPIFLSIGYSTCHWCHVMAHESFEDAAIGRQISRDFVCIKLDREERPDVDRVYMTFVQATTGAGGWPMSVWLTPDLKPFFGGTYFPPSARWGRPGFSEICAELARAWRDERSQIKNSADGIIERLRQATGADSAPDRAPVASRDALKLGMQDFERSFDPRHGGFGGAPKFPRPSELLFLLEASALQDDFRARQMALETLRAMAMGGMRDHVGGGFHRYSVDAEWRVPHFEKMLYDQAQLVLAYLEAGQASGDPFFSAVAEDTLAYVAREMTADDGAFYSAEDADSEVPGEGARHSGLGIRHSEEHAEKKEGAFYVWSAEEIEALFGGDAHIVRRRFGIEDAGNAPADPQGEFRGQNILYIAQTIEDVATRSGSAVEDVMRTLARARQKMFDARGTRPRPHLDDKIIAAWNGLMIAAFARAARLLVDSPRRADWLEAATQAAGAVRKLLWRSSEQRLWRRYRAGEAGVDAFCEDYAYLAWGLLELFQATGDAQWLEWARALTSVEQALFSDDGDGGWFSTTGADPNVLLRLKEDYDGAEPSAASVTVRNLLTLSHLSSETTLHDRAGRTLERYGAGLGRVARVMPLMLSNLVLWHAPSLQIVIVGTPGADDTRAIERAVAARFLPWSVVVPVAPGASQGTLAQSLPWMGAMTMREGRATAYVCSGFACQEPVTTADALSQQLDRAAAMSGGRIIT